ncbi:MAG: HPr family phosphocarrier protein [Gemmatimonadota bacterium]
MQERSVRITNQLGMHARPAAEFVKLADRFQAEIQIAKDGLEVNGKSIMGVLMLAAEKGSEVIIRGVGNDAGEAVDALADLVHRGFGEG